MKAKKTSRKGKPAAKRAAKDLAPSRSSDVKGGAGGGAWHVAAGWDLKSNRKV